MILYSSNIKSFCSDNSKVLNSLCDQFKKKMFKISNETEIESWNTSINYLRNIFKKAEIDDNCTITMEYNIPLTSNRIDVILSGFNKERKETVLVFEIKQWSCLKDVHDSDYRVQTYLNGGVQEVIHPGYQVWSYTQILKDYNEYIQENNVIVKPCLLMYNYEFQNDSILILEKFDKFMCEIEIFGKNDEKKFLDYLKENLYIGDNGSIINNIDISRQKPSKKLQNEIGDLIDSNKLFNLIDDQIVIYDKVLESIKSVDNSVIIIKGGPGTGKSIIAINLLRKIVNDGKSCHYVSRNTAPRVIYSTKLKGKLKKSSIDYLFKSSGSFTATASNSIDVLLVDEAHCLTEKSGLFNNYGDNQIKEIIKTAKNSVFFIDEKQKVHLNDIGTIKAIKEYANIEGRNVFEFELNYQFRCNGSNDYLNFVDYILGYNNLSIPKSIDYDFKIFSSAEKLDEEIKRKNKKYPSRIVAGYCWNWNKDEMNNTDYHDIKIKNFEISWNLGQAQTFVIDDSINEAGCIHSVQGLEFDYVGVIIGNDIKYDGINVVSDYFCHGTADPSFKGIKKILKDDKQKGLNIADLLIKNAYRVLLTRGTKGCYIYCENDEYRNFVKNIVSKVKFSSDICYNNKEVEK